MEEKKKKTTNQKNTPKKKATTQNKEAVKKQANNKSKQKSNKPKQTSNNKKTNTNKKEIVEIKNVEIKNNISEEKKELKVKEVKLPEEKLEKTTEYYDILGQEKSHFFLKFFIVLLLLFIGGFIVYKFVIRDEKAIFSSGINTIYEKLANNIVKISNYSIFNESFEIDGVLTYNTTDKNNDDLNNYSYDIDLALNKNTNNYKINLDIKNNNNYISSINYYYLNNKYYLNLGNNYNKTIELKNNIIDINPSIINYLKIDFNKLNTSAKQIKNIINSNIKRENLSKGTKEINNDTYEYVELTLSNEEYSNVISNIIDEIKNNNTLINNLSKAFNVNNESIINYLEELQKNNLKNNFNEIKFRFYTYGFMANIVGLEIITDNNQVFYYFNHDSKKDKSCDNCINTTFEVILNYNNYLVHIDKNNNIYNVVIQKDNTNYLHLVFNEINDNKIDVNYEINNNNDENYDDHGNIHLEKYDKTKDKSGNFKYSYITKDFTTSYNFDYRINNSANINLNNTNYTEVDKLNEDEYLDIQNNISKSINNKVLCNHYKSLVEKIYNY